MILRVSSDLVGSLLIYSLLNVDGLSSSLLRMERDSEEAHGAWYLPPTASHNPEGNLEFDLPC